MAYRIRAAGLRTRRSEDGGLLVYDETTDTGYVLDRATAIVFDACDGRTTIEEMTRLVAARTELPADEDVVLLALAELRAHGILDEAEPTTQALSAVRTGMTRRQLLKRLAIGTAAAAALPSIVSVANASVLAAQRGLDVFAAVAITVTTSEGVPVVVQLSATGTPGPGTLTFELVTPPKHGTAVIDGNLLTYTPNPGYVGDDTMTYRAIFEPGTTTTDGTTTGGTTTTEGTTTEGTTTTTTTTSTSTTTTTTTSTSTTTTTTTTLGTTSSFAPRAAPRQVVAQQVASTVAPITVHILALPAVSPSFTG